MVLVTSRDCNFAESHIHSKLSCFYTCWVFFIGTCSGMTSVDGSVVCPLRADMAQGWPFKSVTNDVRLFCFFCLFCFCYIQCVWVFKWCDKHSSRVELSSGAVSLHQPWQMRKLCSLPPLTYLLTACYISYVSCMQFISSYSEIFRVAIDNGKLHVSRRCKLE